MSKIKLCSVTAGITFVVAGLIIFALGVWDSAQSEIGVMVCGVVFAVCGVILLTASRAMD